MDVDSAPSAAQGRRERQLRQFLRHEQITVAISLAEKLHHTSRGQKIAKAREEESEMHWAMGQTPPPPPPKAAAAEFYSLTPDAEVGGELAAGEERHLSLRCGRRGGYSGTPWSTSSTSLPSCRSSMYLCRSWWTNWWKS